MKLSTIAVALGAVLAVVGLAFAADVTTQASNPYAVARELEGNWKTNVEITRQLNPDRSVWQLDGFNIVWESGRERQVPTSDAAARDRTMVAGGYITMGGTQRFCALAEKQGVLSLIWWLPGKESQFGEARIGTVNFIQARDHAADLLFLGGEDGARGSTVCFSRSR